ncbi:MAG: hypothetical protein A3B68_08225 [Candidatus Melainabacteria bacterium RIFCSPHIGHO2_02_FULL_34_12]|nr:MAG: hypothetical protein A3B68_08225 [Candidatus Melainabacteria bacterium RIFCSPHIGHO2_02_FULL_34_12]
MNNKISKFRSRRANAMVEMVMIVPLLIMLIGSVFEIGRIYYIQNTLEYGAKEAARIGASVRESTDQNFVSKGTVSRNELEALIKNGVRVQGVIEEPEQFTVKYLNSAGNEVQGVQDLPFDRTNNPGSIDYVQVEIKYPGVGPGVNKPVPAVFNPANVFNGSLTLMSKATFKIEGRFQR